MNKILQLDSDSFFFPHGEVRGLMRDTRTGEILSDFTEHVNGNVANMVVRRAAIAMAACLIPGASSPNITHVAVGTGTTAAAVTQTQLVNEIKRVTPSLSFDNTNGAVSFTNGSYTYTNRLSISAVFDESVVGNLTELGVFVAGTSSSDSGMLFARKVFPAWVKNNSASIEFSWVITF